MQLSQSLSQKAASLAQAAVSISYEAARKGIQRFQALRQIKAEDTHGQNTGENAIKSKRRKKLEKGHRKIVQRPHPKILV